MSESLTQAESRKRDFFDVVKRMFGPTAIEDVPNEVKDEIFFQVYKEQPGVGGGSEPRYRMSAGIINSLLSAYHLAALVDEHFVKFFFYRREILSEQSSRLTNDELEQGVDLFVKVAHWGFGSYLRAFRVLGRDQDIHTLLQDFPLQELLHKSSERIIHSSSGLLLKDMSKGECMACGYAVKPPSGVNSEEARTKAKENMSAYLLCEKVDIYLAGSMRPGEFEEMVDFSARMKAHFKSKNLGPIIFDPTICWDEAPVNKGLLEALMLKRSKIGVMVAGESDSFGKDSEVAHLLSQGKPVVVYFKDPEEVKPSEKRQKLEQRFRLFQDIHPLRLQVSPFNGVAYGIIAVKDEKRCFEVIDDLLLHNLKTRLDYDYPPPTSENGGNGTTGNSRTSAATALYEASTESVLRIITKSDSLTYSFWNRYFEEASPAERISLRWRRIL